PACEVLALHRLLLLNLLPFLLASAAEIASDVFRRGIEARSSRRGLKLGYFVLCQSSQPSLGRKYATFHVAPGAFHTASWGAAGIRSLNLPNRPFLLGLGHLVRDKLFAPLTRLPVGDDVAGRGLYVGPAAVTDAVFVAVVVVEELADA